MKQWFVPYALNINTFQSAKTIKFKQLKPMYPVNELRLKSPYKNLEKSLSMLNEAATSKLRLQLSNTHYVAKTRRPYTMFNRVIKIEQIDSLTQVTPTLQKNTVDIFKSKCRFNAYDSSPACLGQSLPLWFKRWLKRFLLKRRRVHNASLCSCGQG